LKTTTADDVLATLAELFPACFVARHYEPHRPLKIGLRQDLVGILTEAEVNAALGLYCRRLMYRRAIAAGGARIDLAGQPAGEVKAGRRRQDRQEGREGGASSVREGPTARAEARWPVGPEGCRAGAQNEGVRLMDPSPKPKFSTVIRGEPSPRRRRRSRLQIQAMLSAAERQRAALPADHPRIKPTLARLKCLEAPG
jgi:sRNA-binding protein